MAKEKFQNNRSRNDKSGRANGNRRGSSQKNRKFESKEDRFDEEANKGKTKASNHAEWYGADSILMQQAARLPFSNTAGLTVDLGYTPYAADTSNKFVFPGIMNLWMVPTPGTCGDWSDPVNVAIRDMYTFIRHQNSGSKNYDAANLGMYLMVYDSVITYYAWMIRTYGILRMNILKNRYTPEVLVNSQGLDYTDLIQNMAQFASYINTFAARANVMKVPSNFHLFERHMWIYSNIFMDAPLDKAQMYVMNPFRFWKYSLGTDAESTGLFPSYPGTIIQPSTNSFWRASYSDIVEFGEELLNSMLNDEDFNIMSGDIMKAYGDSVFTLKYIEPAYSVSPVYDPEVLLQIHNATIMEHRVVNNDPDIEDDFQDYRGFDVSNWSITEDLSETDNVGAILFNAPLKQYANTQKGLLNVPVYSRTSKLLDTPVENPDPKIVCLATRLMCQVSHDDENWKFDSYGTEIIVAADIVTKSADRDTLFDTMPFVQAEAYYKRELFANRPYFAYVTGDDFRISGPVDNYTIVTSDMLYNIHRASLLGMYGFVK